MTTDALYDSWARYYEDTHQGFEPYIAFYETLVTSETRSFIDLGCGTGAVTIPLAHALGVPAPDRRAVGVDISERMLRIAAEHAPEVEWVVGDIREPQVDGKFDLAISSFNTLQLLTTDEDLSKALRSARRLLARGGRFAFDVYQPNREWLSRPSHERSGGQFIDSRGRKLTIRERSDHDFESEVLTLSWRLEDEQDGSAITRVEFKMRQYYADELERLLAAEGFEIEARFGDLDHSPFGPASRKQVIVCR